eukprot:1452383-Pleurochrysis_carterae.AAC.1
MGRRRERARARAAARVGLRMMIRACIGVAAEHLCRFLHLTPDIPAYLHAAHCKPERALSVRKERRKPDAVAELCGRTGWSQRNACMRSQRNACLLWCTAARASGCRGRRSTRRGRCSTLCGTKSRAGTQTQRRARIAEPERLDVRKLVIILVCEFASLRVSSENSLFGAPLFPFVLRGSVPARAWRSPTLLTLLRAHQRIAGGGPRLQGRPRLDARRRGGQRARGRTACPTRGCACARGSLERSAATGSGVGSWTPTLATNSRDPHGERNPFCAVDGTLGQQVQDRLG